ncbi:MAG: hypothetical protein EOP51_20950 [Sphingobacteriales bacterium]|nr:MAG: hypothetical protein EOP51_20950 [Sphingobacteriales bacterium]
MEKDMIMQDKELDALFRAKLDGLEMEPSAHLWAGIATGLDAKKKKSSLKPYLAIAATILVLITTGILFIPKAKVNATYTAENKLTGQKPVNNTNPVETVVEQKSGLAAVEAVASIQKVAAVHTKQPNGIVIHAKKEIVEQQPEVVPVQQEPLTAVVTQKTEVLNPVTPANDVELSPKTISTEAEPFRTKPVVMASANLPQNEVQETAPVKKKKINSFGGLLNALVAKIDKRKDKLVQFSDNDGENNITGINLGIIKMKTEEQ